MPSADKIRRPLAGGQTQGQPGSSGSQVRAYGATSADGGLVPLMITRREPGAGDVEIDIDFCGLCHCDVHATRGDWGQAPWPLVPGHEIVGRVRRVGADVRGFSVGDRVGVGGMVDSCRACDRCGAGLEQYCERGMVGTYGAPDPHNGGEATQGGYSERIVVDAGYVLRIPDALEPSAAAPILCAGIAVYSPLRRFGAGPGRRVGVVGLGGLGHLAVKFAASMGAEVTVFTHTPSKAADAAAFGAHAVVVSTDQAQLQAAAGTLDVVLDTVAAPHEVNGFLSALRFDGALVALGRPTGSMPPLRPGLLIQQRLTYTGSLMGGIAETQEVLDFCAEHGVAPEIEMVTADALNEAYDRMVDSDVKYRFVLDAASIAGAGAQTRGVQ